MRLGIFLMSVCLLLCACSYYPSRHVPAECSSDEDCNPIRTCGEMIRCVEGKCDREHTIEIPCITRCSEDSDCVLADKGCCCGFSADDYVAIEKENLDKHNNRPECRDAECTYPECNPPDGIWPVCRNRQCEIEYDQNIFDLCSADQDCKKVPSGCPSCRCGDGYEEKAINKDYERVYLQQLERECAVLGACAPGPYGVSACTNRPAVCHQGRCIVLGQECSCPLEWDPICAQEEVDKNVTFPNQCQVDCVGFEWDYHGRCSCEAACLDPDPVCASNGQTYWCGAEEAYCSGHRIRYLGYCDPACDYCEGIDGEQIPVCGTDFHDYLDVCYAECHNVSWWHEGECVQGEGNSCDAGTAPIPCPNDEVFCLPDRECSDETGVPCPGTCILFGHCQSHADCRRQPLTPGDCNGSWRCREHICTWECD